MTKFFTVFPRVWVFAFWVIPASMAWAVVGVQAQPLAENDSRYLPRPDKVDLLLFHAHADDEQLFMAGALPYYGSVQDREVVNVIVNSGFVEGRSIINDSFQLFDGDPANKHWGPRREQELRQVLWDFGIEYEPVYARLPANAHNIATDASWSAWADPSVGDGDPRPVNGQYDPAEVASGKERAVMYVAEQIRRYRPEVVLGHDFGGEYGHGDHEALAFATAAGLAVAADPNVEIAGLEAWQTKKMYVNLWNRGGVMTSTRPLVSRLDHDWNTPYPELGGRTPIEVADQASTDHYISQGQPQIADFRPEWQADFFGLYYSAVGPDTVALDAQGISHGDFFQNIDSAALRPSRLVGYVDVGNHVGATTPATALDAPTATGLITTGGLSAAVTYNGRWAASVTAGHDGDHVFDAEVGAAHSGASTATVVIDGLTAGSEYEIAASWFGGSNRATDSPFSIEGLGGGDGTVLVNQRANPAADRLIAGVGFEVSPFETLFSGFAEGTSVTVSLSNDADGYVILDAFAIYEILPGPTLLGDADGDGDVDAFDITAVRQNFGNTGAADGSLLGDADFDGDVDAFDLTAVEQNFGSVLSVIEASSTDPIPEPTSLATMGLGVLLLLRRGWSSGVGVDAP